MATNRIKTNKTMKIEDQVLSIEQVQELQKLGFDVSKYGSMYYCPNWIEKFGVDEIQDYLLVIGSLYEDGNEDCFPTMTIGDIIEVLPNRIYTDNFYYLTISDGVVKYHSEVFSDKVMFRGFGLTIKDGLFEALKWCIKQKHIEI